MVQWNEWHHNSTFVDLLSFPKLNKISGAVLLVLPGLTAVRLAGKQNSGEFQTFKKLTVHQGFALTALKCFSLITSCFFF